MKRYIWGFPGVGKSCLEIPGFVIEDADCQRFRFRDVVGPLHGSVGQKSFERDLSYPQNYLEHVKAVEANIGRHSLPGIRI